MSNILTLSGSITSAPPLGLPSGAPEVMANLNQPVSVTNAPNLQFTLDADAPVTFDMDGSPVGPCSFLMVSVQGPSVLLEVTSEEGTLQKVPVDPLAIVFSQTSPFTSIRLTRTPSVLTIVNVILGVKPPTS